jgi:hypothetical protein
LPEVLTVNAFPDADSVLFPTRTVVSQGGGPIPFGANLANDTGRLDRGTTCYRCRERRQLEETISQIVLNIPANTTALTYAVTGKSCPS